MAATEKDILGWLGCEKDVKIVEPVKYVPRKKMVSSDVFKEVVVEENPSRLMEWIKLWVFSTVVVIPFFLADVYVNLHPEQYPNAFPFMFTSFASVIVGCKFWSK